MEMLEGWLAILAVVAVLSFGIYYNGYLKRTKGCTAFRLGRVLSFGVTGFLTIIAEKDHPAYIAVVLVFIIVTIIVSTLNQLDCKSWLHAVLMTIWQGLVAITIIYVLYQLSEIGDRSKNHHN
ncbi:hypothetical protein V6615_11315 [Oscillospiraceae bacterium PP1C4]